MTDYQLKKTPNYLYLIKPSVFLASELCGVAVRGRAIIRNGRVRFRITSSYDFLFSLFLFFLMLFFYNNINGLEKGKKNFTRSWNFQFFSVSECG